MNPKTMAYIQTSKQMNWEYAINIGKNAILGSMVSVTIIMFLSVLLVITMLLILKWSIHSVVSGWVNTGG